MDTYVNIVMVRQTDMYSCPGDQEKFPSALILYVIQEVFYRVLRSMWKYYSTG